MGGGDWGAGLSSKWSNIALRKSSKRTERKKERKPSTHRNSFVSFGSLCREDGKKEKLIVGVTATVQITATVGGDAGPPHVIVGKNSRRSLLPL